MYIKSMVIDGFKSYGQRTEINQFDPMFNAITGLNGSGKSNILDSICFLLGITNLSQVRATNLQELVYKNGQAGITKATVSITFDNTDKKQSPVGYDQYDEITVTRQVVVGGRNKYLINGCNAINTRVYDLFRSVQLNVNNPHFLIMQGRITKVLNMKPAEILSMIEEAAGTGMYESKKMSAQRTIEKKDAKLTQIDAILSEEITPTLSRLKEERQAYMEYTKVVRELEHLTKLYVAWQFTQAQSLCQKSTDTLKQIKDTIVSHQEEIAKIEKKSKVLEKQINELEKKKSEEEGGKLTMLEEKLKEHQMTETKINSDIKHINDCLKEENKKRKELQTNYDEEKSALNKKEKEMNDLQSTFSTLEEATRKDTEALQAAQKHFQAVNAGLSSNADGEEASLADQLMTAQSDIAQSETESKQAEMKLKHAELEIKEKKAECKKTEDGYKRDLAQYQALEKQLEKIKAEMEKLNNVDGKEETLVSERRKISRDIENLKDKLNLLESKFPNLTFNYKDPERNFDRRKVHGLVCQLFKIKDSKTATALEIAAGGKLYNVVVDTEITVKKILENCQLKRKYTFIPLNKIMSRPIDADVVRRAERLVGKGNVHCALSLIDYDKSIEPAMSYVFGNVLVVPDMKTAKVVAFADGIHKRTITLDGEVFDPAGTLRGGSRSKQDSVLLQLAEIKEVQNEFNLKQQQLDAINRELLSVKKEVERYRNLKQQYDVKASEASILKSGLEQNTHHKQLEEVQALENSIREKQEILKKCKEVKLKSEQKVKELKKKIQNASALREQESKNAEEMLNRCKKKLENSNKLFKEKQQEVDKLKLEAEELRKGLTAYQEQLKSAEEAVASYETQATEVNKKLNDIKEIISSFVNKVKEQKAHLKAQNEEVNHLHNQREQLWKDVEERKLQIQQLEHDASRTNKESNDAAQKVKSMVASYDWIELEKQYFGLPNTEYDFTANNPKDAGKRLQKLQETKDKLAKNVNMRAHNMMSKAEEQYQDLLQKKRIVENDKAKISAVIKELDEKKNEALKEACEKVNKDFGSIFSMLLPGTRAKLVPPEGKSVLDGLEVKVAFGDVWKESLSELSGGQRSLVALSLILSMLLFKPAPIYILDEVDAALDLSHTQNIGQIIKTYFKHSQFIIVSLKDGMFNNANVLFKTRFVDGTSTVTRYAQHQNNPSTSRR